MNGMRFASLNQLLDPVKILFLVFTGTVLILARSENLTGRLRTPSSGTANVPSLVSLDYFRTPIFPLRFGNFASTLHLLSSYHIFSFAFFSWKMSTICICIKSAS